MKGRADRIERHRFFDNSDASFDHRNVFTFGSTIDSWTTWQTFDQRLEGDELAVSIDHDDAESSSHIEPVDFLESHENCFDFPIGKMRESCEVNHLAE